MKHISIYVAMPKVAKASAATVAVVHIFTEVFAENFAIVNEPLIHHCCHMMSVNSRVP